MFNARKLRTLIVAVVIWICAASLQAGAADRAPDAEGRSVADRVASALRSAGLSDTWVVLTISALPVIELRGGIPAGHTLMMPRGHEVPWSERWRVAAKIFILAVIGNMIPVPFILWLLAPLADFCSRWRIGKIFFDWLFARTRRKSAEIEKYETLGLTIFVAIPLPATGAWTGAMAAFILGMSFRHAMVSILLGVLIAGIVMTILSLLGWVGAGIAGVILLAVGGGGLVKWLKKEETP